MADFPNMPKDFFSEQARELFDVVNSGRPESEVRFKAMVILDRVWHRAIAVERESNA